MNEDFAEYTKCIECNVSLLLCDCNCPKCGKRENCICNLNPIRWKDLGYLKIIIFYELLILRVFLISNNSTQYTKYLR